MFISRCLFVFILHFQNKRLHKIKGVLKKKKLYFSFSHTRAHAKDRSVPSMPMSDTDTSSILGCLYLDL